MARRGAVPVSAEVTTMARTHAPECKRRAPFLPLLHRHPHTHFYFCCLTFFNMKVHSLIHASGIVVFLLLFACAVYRYFGYLLFFPDYKTRVGRVLFSRCPDWGEGGRRVLTVRELFIAYPRRTGFPLFLFVMNYIQ